MRKEGASEEERGLADWARNVLQQDRGSAAQREELGGLQRRGRQARLEELRAWVMLNGRPPQRSEVDEEEHGLADWVANVRRQDRGGAWQDEVEAVLRTVSMAAQFVDFVVCHRRFPIEDRKAADNKLAP